MCGINLVFGCDDEALIDEMNESISHRGIRSTSKTYFDGDFVLGHRRLPIQGLDDEFDQPMGNRDFDVAFVGEIYNYKAFGKEYKTDTAVVLDQYTKEGPRCFNRFDGFWSAVVVDKKNEKVHLFTDHLAKKPLYTATFKLKSRKITLVSSEMRAIANIIRATDEGLKLDKRNLGAIRKWGYACDGSTIYDGIYKLPASKHIVIDRDGDVVGEDDYLYWKPLFPHKESFLYSMNLSVANRLVSDVPVSLLLSGGLDSSIVYSHLLKMDLPEINVFHVDNGDEEDKMFEYLPFPNNVKVTKLKYGEHPLKEVVRANQDPVDLGSMVPQYSLGRAVSEKGFNVVVSGDGADEFFGGYKRAREYDSQYSDVFHELVYYHLPRLDRLMMASTVELRCPFLSPIVMRAALGFPWKDMRTNKEYLKQTYRGILPTEILDRQKVPLRNPEYQQNKKEWSEKVIKTFLKVENLFE